MNKTGCIHPALMSALSLCGHGDKILIADGNYPLESRCGDPKRIYLGLTAGIPTVTDVLKVLLEEINVEAATVMVPDGGDEPAIFSEFRKLLPGTELRGIGRFEFYDEAMEPGVRIAISTGEKRTYANILLTVGVS